MSASAPVTIPEPSSRRRAPAGEPSPAAGSGIRRARPYRTAAAASLLLAAVSLLYPSAPAYDPYAWIIWGREIIHLQLATLGAPTWKPLPVLFTTLFAPFGHAAPELWLLLARAGGLMAVAMGALLASRLAGPDRRSARLAGALAAGGLLGISQLIDSVALGKSEGLLIASTLLAILSQLDGRPRQALAFGTAAALIRPEIWPFLGLFGLYLWRQDRSARKLIVGLFVLIPVLWFVPDLVGSGSLTRGVQWAQFDRAGSPAFARCPFCSEITGHAWPLTPTPLKAGIVLALGWIGSGAVRGPRRASLLALVGIGVAWILEDAVLTQAGFTGSDRYLIAPVAVLAVAGAAGWGLTLRERRMRVALWALVLSAVVSVMMPWRWPHLGRTAGQLRYQASVSADLRLAVQRAGGTRALIACGPVQTNPSESPLAAWVLGVKMRWTESADGDVLIQSRNGPDGPVLPTPPAGAHYRVLVHEGAVTILTRCASTARSRSR